MCDPVTVGFVRLVTSPRVLGDRAVDVEAAADALVHGASVATADAGFARFTGVRRINPLVD